jgi:uncharacterized protein YihD (DUF1040 family)
MSGPWLNNDPKLGRDPARIEVILDLLKAAWLAEPQQRLCQLLSNVAFNYDRSDGGLFHFGDDRLIEALDQELKK